MAGLIEKARDWFFLRSPLGRSIDRHLNDQFRQLVWADAQTKLNVTRELRGKISEVRAARKPWLALREAIGNVVVSAAELQTLCMTEEEKTGQPYADNPYISGALHPHIAQAAPLSETFAKALAETPPPEAEELMGFANRRSALLLVILNGLQLLRLETNDHIPDGDWLRPLMEAQMAWQEDLWRDKLGLPRLLPPPYYDALRYSGFLNMVVTGERDPLAAWRAAAPDLYLAAG